MACTRRTALKALASIAMTPIVRLRQEIDREAVLRGFSGEKDGYIRYDLEQPFGVGSLTYATDARWMARAEIANRVETGERRLPPVSDCWKKLWVPAREFAPLDLPSVDSLTLGAGDYHECPECGNRRIFLGETYPDADRMEQLTHDHDYDIDTNTIRDKSCARCHGRPYAGAWQVEVAGVLHSYARLKVIAAIPDVRVSSSDADHCLLFVGDGFEGMSMGLHRT